MKVISGKKELRAAIKTGASSPSGLVPTMGALHDGHLSLVETAIRQCGIVTVSIFVNPTQFNDKKDLSNYPRTLEADLRLLGKVLRDQDIVFTPEAEEMYPEEDKRQFSFGNLDSVMEASHRPGHFNGVAQIVSKLFLLAEPDYAYFGMKDFQQLAIIKDLVKQLRLKVNIVSCPIIRENDGLAMSSRNRLLEPDIRKNSPVIYKTLSEASRMITNMEISDIRTFVAERINSIPGFSVEYFEIADDEELIPVRVKKEMLKDRRYRGFIAVKAGKIRLIDNIDMK